MSDFGAAPRMDWSLQSRSHESPLFKWGLPLLPHLYETFLNAPTLPAFEASLDRLLLQEQGSIDRNWVKKMAQKTDLCLFGRLSNLAGEKHWSDSELKIFSQCVEEISPRWLALAVGFNEQRGHSVQNPLPVPKTPEMLDLLTEKILRIREHCKREVSLVNVATMFKYSYENLSEVEFWNKLIERTGCSLILDIPAFFVSLYYREQDFETELRKMPLDSIVSVRVGALALSTQGVVDAECGRLSVTHWGLLEDVLQMLPADQHRAVFLKWFEPLVTANDLVSEIIRGQGALQRLGEL